MRKKKFSKIARGEKKELEVDITSLLDILVILLVFLLKSYNASDLKLEVADKLSLPSSKSQDLGNHTVIVQVNEKRDLWINNNKIGRISDSDNKIDILFNKLKSMKEEEEKSIKEMEGRAVSSIDKEALAKKKVNSKRVNIVLDQSLPYEVLRQVMHTAAMAGYPEFKFIVQGNF